MGIIIIIIAIILVCAGSSSSGGYSGSSSDFWGSSGGGSFLGASRNKDSYDTFEEADSFFDRNGEEHIIDDEGYCEDCDDYHDDF